LLIEMVNVSSQEIILLVMDGMHRHFNLMDVLFFKFIFTKTTSNCLDIKVCRETLPPFLHLQKQLAT
jgi:hypothetical protein